MKTLFDISNHPIATNVVRKVRVQGPFIDFSAKTIRLPFWVEHYVNDELEDNYFKTEFASLFTSNQKFVNNLGQRVELIQIEEEDELGTMVPRLVAPEGSIPEFDFLFSHVSEKETVGEVLLELVEFIIYRNDQNGLFNDMKNFRE